MCENHSNSTLIPTKPTATPAHSPGRLGARAALDGPCALARTANARGPARRLRGGRGAACPAEGPRLLRRWDSPCHMHCQARGWPRAHCAPTCTSRAVDSTKAGPATKPRRIRRPRGPEVGWSTSLVPGGAPGRAHRTVFCAGGVGVGVRAGVALCTLLEQCTLPSLLWGIGRVWRVLRCDLWGADWSVIWDTWCFHNGVCCKRLYAAPTI